VIPKVVGSIPILVPSQKKEMLRVQHLFFLCLKKCIEQFYKDDKGGWHLGEVVTEGSLQLKSIDVEISIDDLYFNIDLRPSSDDE
jgi:hypothetical protein